MLDKKQFSNLISALAELYGKELSIIAINLYYEVLKEYPYDIVEKAFCSVAKTYKYNCIPKPAEFIEAIIEIRQREQLNNDDNIKQLYVAPSPEELKKIRDLVQGVVDKC